PPRRGPSRQRRPRRRRAAARCCVRRCTWPQRGSAAGPRGSSTSPWPALRTIGVDDDLHGDALLPLLVARWSLHPVSWFACDAVAVFSALAYCLGDEEGIGTASACAAQAARSCQLCAAGLSPQEGDKRAGSHDGGHEGERPYGCAGCVQQVAKQIGAGDGGGLADALAHAEGGRAQPGGEQLGGVGVDRTPRPEVEEADEKQRGRAHGGGVGEREGERAHAAERQEGGEGRLAAPRLY